MSVMLETPSGFVDYHDDLNVLMDEPDGFVRNTAVRDVNQARPGRRGTQTRSKFAGSSTIAIKCHIFGSDRGDTRARYDKLAAAAQYSIAEPRLLKWTEPGSSLELQSYVRLVAMEDPQWEQGAPVLKIQHQFRSDDPRAYSQSLQTVRSLPLGAQGQGMTLPATMPVHFNEVISFPRVSVSNLGEIGTPALIRVFGYVLNPKVRIVSTGEEIALTGEIGAGSFMEIDTDARTIRLNGDPNASRLGLRDPALTTWWEIPEGQHTIVLLSDAQDSQAALEVDWRDARP